MCEECITFTFLFFHTNDLWGSPLDCVDLAFVVARSGVGISRFPLRLGAESDLSLEVSYCLRVSDIVVSRGIGGCVLCLQEAISARFTPANLSTAGAGASQGV